MRHAVQRERYRPTVSRQAVWLVLGSCLALLSCRDAPALFDPVQRTPLEPAPYRLTFSGAPDVSPAWSADGESVFYLSENVSVSPAPPFDTLRVTRIARKIPAEGGTAVAVLPVLQAGATSTSVERVSASSTGMIAAFILSPLHSQTICGADFALCGESVGPPPELDAAVIKVQDASTGTVTEAELAIDFPGRFFDTSNPPPGLTGVHVIEVFPFQRAFADTRRVPSHISWAPEGDRLVVSDGVGLLVWNPSTGATSRIPGSEDGLNPAWSPAGDWIAFERLERGSPTETECVHRVGDTVQCIERRTEWTLPRRSLAIVRPGGELLRLLPDGTLPAWSHDGRFVYYEFGDAIWRVGLDGENPVLIPGTENSYEPAVSPDGALLAVTRRDTLAGSADIWVVPTIP